jgi:hypothetical protein
VIALRPIDSENDHATTRGPAGFLLADERSRQFSTRSYRESLVPRFDRRALQTRRSADADGSINQGFQIPSRPILLEICSFLKQIVRGNGFDFDLQTHQDRRESGQRSQRGSEGVHPLEVKAVMQAPLKGKRPCRRKLDMVLP